MVNSNINEIVDEKIQLLHREIKGLTIELNEKKANIADIILDELNKTGGLSSIVHLESGIVALQQDVSDSMGLINFIELTINEIEEEHKVYKKFLKQF